MNKFYNALAVFCLVMTLVLCKEPVFAEPLIKKIPNDQIYNILPIATPTLAFIKKIPDKEVFKIIPTAVKSPTPTAISSNTPSITVTVSPNTSVTPVSSITTTVTVTPGNSEGAGQGDEKTKPFFGMTAKDLVMTGIIILLVLIVIVPKIRSGFQKKTDQKSSE